MKNTSLIDPSRCGIVKNNQGAYVSKNEAYALAQTVKDMFVANGIGIHMEDYYGYKAYSERRNL